MDITASKIPTSENYSKFVQQAATQLKAKYPSWSKQKIQAAVQQEWVKKTSQKPTQSNKQGSPSSDKDNNIKMSNNKKSLVSPHKLDFGSKEKNLERKQIQKTKRILKRSGGKNFINFTKFYKNTLHIQHPKWSEYQIDTIAHLLWRKKNILDKKSKKTSSRVFKVISGRAYFGKIKRQEQNLSNSQIQKKWRGLTQENKRHYKVLGAGGEPQKCQNQTRIKNQEPKTNGLSFMHKF